MLVVAHDGLGCGTVHRAGECESDRRREEAPDHPGENRPVQTTIPFMSALVLALLLLAPGATRAHEAGHHEPDAEERALLSIVAAERALAQDLSARATHAAATRILARDAIVLGTERPAAREAARAPQDRQGTITREPAQIGLTRTHDLAYSTGPYTRNRGHPSEGQGLFLTVWRRERNEWRIVLDTAVRTGASVDFVELGPAPRPSYAGKTSIEAARSQVQAREEALQRARSATAPGSGAPPLRTLLADNVRLYRDGAAPVVGAMKVIDAWREHDDAAYQRPQTLLIGNGADLAVSHGARKSKAAGDAYVHVWLRDQAGAWHLAFEVIPGTSTLADD